MLQKNSSMGSDEDSARLQRDYFKRDPNASWITCRRFVGTKFLQFPYSTTGEIALARGQR